MVVCRGREVPKMETDGLDTRTLNLNSASREVLARLPMVGPKRARALIQHRPHRSWDEVEQIPGFDRLIAQGLQARGAYLGVSLRYRQGE